MASYRISQKAISDLDEIWDYTFNVWSEEQADRYYTQLYEAIIALASMPDYLGRKFESIKPGLWGYGVGRHIFFYHKEADGLVWVDRILHEKMDYTRHL